MSGIIKQLPSLPELSEIERFGRIVARLEDSYKDTDARSIEEPAAYEVFEHNVLPYAAAFVKKALAGSPAATSISGGAGELAKWRAEAVEAGFVPCFVRPAGDYSGWCLVAENDRAQDSEHQAMDFASFSDEEVARFAAACLNTPALAASPASVTSPVEPAADGWIDCAGRMPEAVEPVLVLSVIPGDSRVYIARWMPHASPARWWLRDSPEQLAVVTHWQPLPQAPATDGN